MTIHPEISAALATLNRAIAAGLPDAVGAALADVLEAHRRYDPDWPIRERDDGVVVLEVGSSTDRVMVTGYVWWPEGRVSPLRFERSESGGYALRVAERRCTVEEVERAWRRGRLTAMFEGCFVRLGS